jgi:hypothetical protein
MDYGSVTMSILKLAEMSTIWESTIKIPIADNQNSLLDTSSTARGQWSVTPDGATKQPSHYPPGFCYMFDPDLYGENLWEKLKGMLTKVGCVSWCSVVIHSSCQNKTTNWKETYLLCCSHGLLVEEMVQLNMMVMMLVQAMLSSNTETCKNNGSFQER